MVKLRSDKKMQKSNENKMGEQWISKGKKTMKTSRKNGWCAANCGAQPIIPQNPARVTLIQVDRRALTNKIRRTKAITTKNNFNIKNFNKRTLI